MTQHTVTLKDEKATLTPAWLRKANADPKAVLFIAAPHLATIADALDIAYHAARSDIECFCNATELDGVRWYDLGTADDDDRQWTEQGARHLDARGLLIRHADRPHLVRVEDAPE